MSITPNEIIEMDFRTKMRGYDPDEVRDFLELVAKAFAASVKECNLLKNHITMMRGKIEDFKQKNEEFRIALTSAHNISEEMKKQAKKEAELIIERARLDAEKIIENAHTDSIKLDERIRHLRHLHRDTLFKVRAHVESLLETLEEEALPMHETHHKPDAELVTEDMLIIEETAPTEAEKNEAPQPEPEIAQEMDAEADDILEDKEDTIFFEETDSTESDLLETPFSDQDTGKKAEDEWSISPEEEKTEEGDYNIDLIASELRSIQDDLDLDKEAEKKKEPDLFETEEGIDEKKE
jgi:cell division initiation protein